MRSKRNENDLEFNVSRAIDRIRLARQTNDPWMDFTWTVKAYTEILTARIPDEDKTIWLNTVAWSGWKSPFTVFDVVELAHKESARLNNALKELVERDIKANYSDDVLCHWNAVKYLYA